MTTTLEPQVARDEERLSTPRLDLRQLAQSEPAVLTAMLLALGIFYFGPGLPSAVLGALLFFGLTLYRPDLSLVMVPLTAPLFYRPRTLTGDKYLALSEVVILIGIAAWLVRDGWTILRTRRIPNLSGLLRLLREPFIPFALALGIICTLWLLVPPAGDPRKLALRDFRWTVAEPVIFFAMMLRWLNKERDLWRMTGAWLIAAALTGREGAQQYFFGQTWSMEGVGRVTSFYPSATAFGIYAGRGLALALVLAIFLPKQAWRWRIASALLSISIGLGVLFSFARGAWIGVFVALLVVAIVSRFRPFLITMLSLTAAGAALALVVMLKLATIPFLTAERITSMFNFDTPDNTAVSRIRIWQAALRVIADHPFTGIGQDQFLRVDPKYGVPHVRFLTVSHPHNWVLDFWLRLGIPGVAWMFAALAYFFYTVARLWGRYRGTALGALALGLLASMVDFAVHGLMDMAYFTMDLALTFWLTVGLVAIMQRLKPTEVDPGLP